MSRPSEGKNLELTMYYPNRGFHASSGAAAAATKNYTQRKLLRTQLATVWCSVLLWSRHNSNTVPWFPVVSCPEKKDRRLSYIIYSVLYNSVQLNSNSQDIARMVKTGGDGEKHSSGFARVMGSGTAGLLELILFHPVDTIAKRLMTNEVSRVTAELLAGSRSDIMYAWTDLIVLYACSQRYSEMEALLPI
jgi:hypothetical protein